MLERKHRYRTFLTINIIIDSIMLIILIIIFNNIKKKFKTTLRCGVWRIYIIVFIRYCSWVNVTSFCNKKEEI